LQKTLVFKKNVVSLQLELIIYTKLLKCWPMCKKIYSLLFILLCSVSVFAAKTDGPKGAHPWKLSENENGVAPKFAHWTIVLEGGFNSFDGDFGSEMKFPVWAPAAGLALEYNFTPIWTIGIEGFYDWYRVTGKNTDQHAAILLDGMMARGQAYLAFDLMSACYPRAKKKIFGLDLSIGGGAGWFKNDTYYTDDTRQHTATSQAKSDSKFSKAYPFVQAGILFDFNLGRVTSLGLKGTYSYYIKDLIDGRGEASVASKNNDGIIDVTLALRFKLASVKKTHVKNIASYDMFDKFNETERQKDTLVVTHVDTLYMISEGGASTAGLANFREDDYYFIYFEHNKNGLDDKALIEIQQLATRMTREQDLCAEIIGYADNTGDEDHNQNLGVARAQNIRDELVEEHNIDPSRITYSSGGTIKGGRSVGAYTPNRRADVHVMPCSEFGAIKQANDDREAMAAQARAQAMAERENGVITAPEGMTLSAIARKYYGNTYCWVYIYDANRKTLKSPNYIPQGTRLVIPDLTEEQLNVSKRNAELFYEKIK